MNVFPSKRAASLLALFLLIGSLACARATGTGEGGFTEGNRLYAAGQFADAAKAYEGAVHQGDYRANLFYNLANAYYRLGDRGRAILNYQRTLLLEPGHAEAAANLAFVRGRALSESGTRPPGTLPAVREALAGPGVDVYGWLAAGAGWLGLLGLGLAIFRPRARVAGTLLAVAGAAGCVLLIGIIDWLDGGLKSPQRAVVLADDTPALYAPADNAKAIVRLPVGGEVHILSEQGPWEYVRLADGTRGWMATDKLGRVDPAAGG